MSDPTWSNDDRPSTIGDSGLISSGSAPDPSRVGRAWEQRPTGPTGASAGSAPSQTTPDSSDSSGSTGSVAPAAPTVILDSIECRVLGAMIEKSFLTPDIYPMTTNALVNACNQKTNREPVVDYDATTVDAALLEMRQRSLVRRVHTPGSRSTKHRQTLDEVLELAPPELALVSVLLLRGPQTVGELRLRTERHDVGFDDLDTVESTLDRLADRAIPLVQILERQPGHKENRWRHLLHDPDDVDSAASLPAASSAAAASPGDGSSRHAQTAQAAPVSSAAPVSADGALRDRVAELEADVATLRAQLERLAASLGETLS